MTKPKFTQGPWRVSGKQSIRGPNGEYIAKTNWNNGAANAHLTATAPEMYEALSRALLWIAWPSEEKYEQTKQSVIDQARNALTKARGEA